MANKKPQRELTAAEELAYMKLSQAAKELLDAQQEAVVQHEAEVTAKQQKINPKRWITAG